MSHLKHNINYLSRLCMTLGTSLILIILALSCAPKNQPRYLHEEKREWVAQSTPEDRGPGEGEFLSFSLDPLEKSIGKMNDLELMDKVVKPLSHFVLNSLYVENPKYHTLRLRRMISLFNQALLSLMNSKNHSIRESELKGFQEHFLDTVFSGCSRDLRNDCINQQIMGADSRSAQILVVLARSLDDSIQKEVSENKGSYQCIEKSENCRRLVEERYRRLAMANEMKTGNIKDEDFTFSYLKYSRLYALLTDWWQKHSVEQRRQQGQMTKLASPVDNMSKGHLNALHGKIFQSLILQYDPKNLADQELRRFVENFNPWTYSNRQGDVFRYGTEEMFKLGSRCCLYQDSKRLHLNPSLVEAILQSQEEKDPNGLTLSQIIDEVKKNKDIGIFSRLGMRDELSQVLSADHSFFDECFFVVDRLFREHLDTKQVENVLLNVNRDRCLKRLPVVVDIFVKVHLVHLILKTNDFMRSIYLSEFVGSDQVFQEALQRSRNISEEWAKLQSRIEILSKMLENYFETQGRSFEKSHYLKVRKMLQSVNHNIHLISVYPNMLVMGFHLAKMQGKVNATTWWGKTISVSAQEIIDQLFNDRIDELWFRFGNNPEAWTREMVPFVFHYAMSTQVLNNLTDKEDNGKGKGSQSSDRTQFFDLIFSEYLGPVKRKLQDSIQEFERETTGSRDFGLLNQLCHYELGGSGVSEQKDRPLLSMNFTSLADYTYSGAGDKGLRTILTRFLGLKSLAAIQLVRGEVDQRLTYVQMLMDIIEQELIDTGQITAKEQDHPDLNKTKKLVNEINGLKFRLVKNYVSNHKNFLNCLLRLDEVEQRRMNRLYEAERSHLKNVYDEIKKLLDQQLAGPSFKNAVDRINQRVFSREKEEYQFDHLDGTTYQLYQYDLLMRIKRNILADIFAVPSEQEKKNSIDQLYYRRRSVSIQMEAGLNRSLMMSQGIYLSVPFTEKSEDFIRQGMAVFNGKTESFVKWASLIADESDLKKYLSTLIEYYLLGPVTDTSACNRDDIECLKDHTSEVTADDLINAYKSSLQSYSMSPADMARVRELGLDGKKERDFFDGVVFDKSYNNRLPLFYHLMKELYDAGQLKMSKSGSEIGAVNEAYHFAEVFNNLDFFIFSPPSTIRESVKNRYGVRVHQLLERVHQAFDQIRNIAEDPNLVGPLRSNFDLPLYFTDEKINGFRLENGAASVVDYQKIQNLNVLIEDFIQQSGNFYGTKSSFPGRK